MKKPVSAADNRFILIDWEKFKNEKIRCIMKHINIDVINPKNRLKFTMKNSKLFKRKYVSRRVFKSVTSLEYSIE